MTVGAGSRQCLAIVAAAFVSAAVAAPANALRISKFRVWDAGDTITWRVTVCAQPGRLVYFRPRLWTDERGPYFRGTAVARQKRHCMSWDIDWPDEYGEGQHHGRVKVRVPATGAVRWTRTQSLWIS